MITLKTVVKNSIRDYGMIQAKELKAIVDKRVTVTIDVDEGTEITQPVPTLSPKTVPVKPLVVA